MSFAVHRDCYGLSPLKTIYKVFHQFHFQFATYWTSVNMNVLLYPETVIIKWYNLMHEKGVKLKVYK